VILFFLMTTQVVNAFFHVFFRLDEHKVRLGIADSLKIDVDSLDRQKTFVGLRGLRDNW